MDIFLRWPIHTFLSFTKAALTLHYNPLLAFVHASSLRAL